MPRARATPARSSSGRTGPSTRAPGTPSPASARLRRGESSRSSRGRRASGAGTWQAERSDRHRLARGSAPHRRRQDRRRTALRSPRPTSSTASSTTSSSPSSESGHPGGRRSRLAHAHLPMPTGLSTAVRSRVVTRAAGSRHGGRMRVSHRPRCDLPADPRRRRRSGRQTDSGARRARASGHSPRVRRSSRGSTRRRRRGVRDTGESTCSGTRGNPCTASLGGTVTFAAPLAGRGVVVVDHGGVRTTYEPVGASVEVGDQVGPRRRARHAPARRRATASRGPACTGDCCAATHYLNPLTLVGAGPVRLLPLSGDLVDALGGPQPTPLVSPLGSRGGSVVGRVCFECRLGRRAGEHSGVTNHLSKRLQ